LLKERDANGHDYAHKQRTRDPGGVPARDVDVIFKIEGSAGYRYITLCGCHSIISP
jgi:hypothetical protein